MKILFTDLDGTLLGNDSLVSEGTKSFLEDFTKKGNLIVPASGRPLLSIQKLIDSSGLSSFVKYICAYNGALIYDCQDEKNVWDVRIPFDKARLIQDKCIEERIHIQTYNHETVYTLFEDISINYYKKRIFLPVKYTADPIGMCDEEPFKMLAIDISDHDRLCKLMSDLEPMISDHVSMVFSNPYYLEFFNKKAGKGNALIELCKLLNIPLSDSFAAGDEENDISMIRAAGCGIAMANATGSVKASADLVTVLDNDSDGLIKALSQI